MLKKPWLSVVHRWHGTQASPIPGDHPLNVLPLGEVITRAAGAKLRHRGRWLQALRSLRRTTPADLYHYSVTKIFTGWQQSHGYQLVKLLGRCGLRFKKQLDTVKLLTLEVFLHVPEESSGRNPAWQQVYVRWSPTWDRVLTADTRRTRLSLAGFLKDYLEITHPDEVRVVSRVVLREFLPYVDLKFQVVWGGTPEFAATIEGIYTRPLQGRHVYPSVSGSCMAEPFDDCPVHPVRAYDTPDVGLVYALNDDDKTVCRALLNVPSKTASRVYTASPDGTTAASITEALTCFLSGLGYTLDFGRGMDGCRLLAIEDGYGRLIAPYVDGGATYYTRVGDYLVIQRGSTASHGSLTSADGYAEQSEELCERCGGSCSDSTHRDVWSFDILCGDCYDHCDNYWYQCSHCGCWADTSDEGLIEGELAFCNQSCLDSYGDYCYRCEDFFHSDDLTWCGYEGGMFCGDCYEEREEATNEQ